MRLLYFGDFHERPTSPENRIDNFQEAMMNKRKEIISLGEKYQVSAFLQGGDFFDSPSPPLNFVANIMKVWTNVDLFDLLSQVISGDKVDQEEALKKLKGYIPIIGIVGNHELYGNNIKTLPKTMIGFLNQLGIIKFATKENPYIFTTEDGLKVAVTGTHFHLDIDTPEHLDDYIIEEKQGDIHIHLVHGMLSDKAMGKFVRYTLIDQIKHTKADVTIAGHNHIGFPLTEIDGKYFVNTGAIPRISNDLKEIRRIPKVLLIDITKKDGLKLKEIPLRSALDGEKVLSREKIMEKKAKESRLEEYKKAVRDAGMKKDMDIIEIIRDLADTKEISQKLKENLIDQISKKKMEMNPEADLFVKDAVVEKIILNNFQSHIYTEIPLNKGFNIFVGESSQGKTAVFRAFRWVYENKPTGKRMIRQGADFAKVTVVLSNRYQISRYIESKRGGKNGYEIIDPSGEVTFHNTKILPEVQKLLGFTQFTIDKDMQFDLNFLQQGTGWFLIGDHFTDQQKAKIIGAIYGTHFADAVLRDLDAENRKVSELVKREKTELDEINDEISKYNYLQDLENTIHLIQDRLEKTERLKERKETIEKLLEKRKIIETSIQENERILHSFEQISKAKSLFNQVKMDCERSILLKKVFTKYTKLKKCYHELIRSLQQTKEIPEAMKRFSDLKEQTLRLEKILKFFSENNKNQMLLKREKVVLKETEDIEKIREQMASIKLLIEQKRSYQDKLEKGLRLTRNMTETENKLKGIENVLIQTKDIEKGKELLTTVIDSYQRKEKMKTILYSHSLIQSSIQEQEKIIKSSKLNSRKLVKEYQQLLEKAGKCPVCYGSINKATVNRIIEAYQIN